LDHGVRHPLMSKRSNNCFILTCNVSLEWEKSTVNSGFMYKNADEKEKLVRGERKFTDDRIKQVIDLRNKVLVGDKKDYNFVIINQKGIDPISLDILQKAGIVAIRRAKRRNMERLARACGGYAVNSFDDMEPDCLGFAGLIYEHTVGEDKFTYIEKCKHPTSCTILIKGPNEHTIQQIKDAARDGLRAVKNVYDDKSVIPGAGAFEVSCSLMLQKFKASVPGRAKLGVEAFANALLIIPKTLAANSGKDATEAIINLMEKAHDSKTAVGLDIITGQTLIPAKVGIWDNTKVKQQFLHLGSLIALKLLLVDEVIRAGKKVQKEQEDEIGREKSKDKDKPDPR